MSFKYVVFLWVEYFCKCKLYYFCCSKICAFYLVNMYESCQFLFSFRFVVVINEEIEVMVDVKHAYIFCMKRYL